MGRNSPTSRQVMEEIGKAIEKISSSMRSEDRELVREIILMGRTHASEMDLSLISPEMAFLLSAIIEMLREIKNE